MEIRNTEDKDQVTDIWSWVGKTQLVQIIRNYQVQVQITRIDQDETLANHIRYQQESRAEVATMSKDKTLVIKPK